MLSAYVRQRQCQNLSAQAQKKSGFGFVVVTATTLFCTIPSYRQTAMKLDHCLRICNSNRTLCLGHTIAITPQPNTPIMSDNEYNIESADAGASETIPMEAGQIKKGG
jgi:hypothetical protein